MQTTIRNDFVIINGGEFNLYFFQPLNHYLLFFKIIKYKDRDMIARELLVKFQMSKKHPLVDLKKAYLKF